MSAGVACIAFVVGFFVVGVVIFQKAAVGANMGAEEWSILWMHAGFLGGGIGEPVLLSPCLHWVCCSGIVLALVVAIGR